MFTIRKGLNVPISGAPAQQIDSSDPALRSVAVLGPDYNGMKPTMMVSEGDVVSQGQKLFEDKRNPGVFFTSPAAGKVSAIHRGERRVLESVVVDIDPDGQALSWASHGYEDLAKLDRAKAVEQLVDSGQWVAFRTRPFSQVPSPESVPQAIFVTAIDTNPLAVDPDIVIQERASDFKAGVSVLTRLTEGKVFVCTGDNANSDLPSGQAEQHAFRGPHPAGLAGTHIAKLHPVNLNRVVWTINYQDVIAIGALFTTGKLSVERVISIAGPQVKTPRIVRACLGADLSALTTDNLKEGDNRIISGSILAGRKAADGLAYLGRYDLQVTVLEEGHERPVLHYVRAGKDRFSALPIYISRFFPNKRWDFTTTTNGSERAMVPIGAYEQIMPLDILPTQLLRALIVGDTASAQELGALELDEEDLALCTFVCPGKYEYGPILRDNLTRIEKEG